MKKSKQWGASFYAEHGVWPIGGGSGNDAPPAPEGGEQGDTITIPSEQQPSSGEQAGEHRGETPPARPAGTYEVDPGAFNRGSQEAPGQQPSGEQQPPSGRVFTEEEVERIRQQEKDKVYGRIDELSNELRTLREEREAEQRAIEEEEARKRQEAEAQSEEEMDLRELLQKKEQEWTQRFSEIQEQQEQSQALLEKERQFNALQEYKRQLLEQHEDDIMPHLRDLVDGNSEEELQSSVNRAIEKTQAIMADVTAAQQQQMQQTPTTRVTQPGDGGPLEQTTQASKSFSPQDIQSMSMSEYAQYREQLMRAASNRGPYGG